MKKFKLRDWVLVVFCVAMLSAWAYPGISQMIGGGMIGNAFSGGVVPNPILAPSGSGAAPSYSFAADPTTGAYYSATNNYNITVGGLTIYQFQQSGLYLLSNTAPIILGSNFDTVIARDAANTLALKNGNYDQHSRIYGANGTYRDEGAVSELLTINAAASTDTTMTIPANAVVYGVSVRVTIVIPTAATFTVTGAVSTTAFQTGASVSTAADTTDAGTKTCPYLNTAAQSIRITPNAQPANNTGRVRITIHYYFINPATS